MRGEDFDIHLFAAAQRDGEAGIILAIEELEGRGLGWGNQDRDGPGGELEQSCGALLLHIGVRRKIFKREDIVRRETDHPAGIDGASEFATGAENGLKSFGCLVVGNDQNDRLASGAGQERQVERTRGRGQSRHTSPARTKVEVPLYAIEGGRVLQLRENFADEGEDHESLVYQCGCAPSTRRRVAFSKGST